MNGKRFKRKWSRVGACLLAVLMVVMSIPLSAFAASGVTISPDTQPGEWTYGQIGSNGNMNNYGGSVTKKVGESGFYRRCPINSIIGAGCGHIVAEYTPDYYCGFSTSVSNSEVVGNISYGSGVWSGGSANGAGCLEASYKALKPGRANVGISYYVNFMVMAETGYCGTCGRATSVPRDYTWHAYGDNFDVTVTADYELNYAANGDKVTNMPSATIKRNIANTKADLTVSSTKPSREGYKFVGWSEDPEAKSADYSGGQTITLNWEAGATVRKTLYAIWEKETYTVTYTDGVEGEIVFADQVYEDLKKDSDTPAFQGTPSREGYTFEGWAPAVSEKVTEDVTYVATWSKNAEIYTVRYTDGLDGEVFGDLVYNKCEAGSKTPEYIGSLSRKGYVFNGWTPAWSETVTGDVTYTATWAKICTVTYTDGVAEEVIFADQVYDGLKEGSDTPAFQGTPSREGYTFEGWAPAVSAKVTEDVTYVATWSKNPDPTPTPDPVDPDPTPTPDPVDPDPTPTPDPVDPDPTPTPDPGPVNPNPDPGPVNPNPDPGPVNPTPDPDPVDPTPDPDPVDPTPDPDPVDPTPDPDPVDPTPDPDPVDPTPDPDPVDPTPDPDPVDPTPDPDPVDPTPDPDPVDPTEKPDEKPTESGGQSEREIPKTGQQTDYAGLILLVASALVAVLVISKKVRRHQ